MKKQNHLFKQMLAWTLLMSGIMGTIPAYGKPGKADIQKQVYQAYLLNSIATWEHVVQTLNNKKEQNPGDTELLYQLTSAQYGLLTAALVNQDKEVYKKYHDQAHDHTDKLIKETEMAKAHALKAGLYSIDMGFHPMKGMFLGPKNSGQIQQAIRINKNEPTAWLQKASSRLHTPEQYGGSLKEAIKYYKKAISLFEKDTANLQYNCQYLNCLAWLGQAYNKNQQPEKALEIFNKALKAEANFGWVKYHLLPNTQKKIKGKD